MHSELWASCLLYCCVWQEKQSSYISAQYAIEFCLQVVIKYVNYAKAWNIFDMFFMLELNLNKKFFPDLKQQ